MNEDLVESMLQWHHTGFSVHIGKPVGAHDDAGRESLAQYVARGAVALERMPVTQATRDEANIGAMYFPGLKTGTHHGWQRIVPFPERRPALGYYDEEKKANWDRVREACVKKGFGGILVFGGERTSGFDAKFTYCKARDFNRYKGYNPKYGPHVPTLSMGWSAWPWSREWQHGWRLDKTGRLDPYGNFRENCRALKKIMDALPKESLGKKVLIVDNWNEWGEGHYVMPHRQYGFGYLDAIREVFTEAPAEHEDLTPEDVGLGPYETGFRAAFEKENLGPYDAIIRELAE